MNVFLTVNWTINKILVSLFGYLWTYKSKSYLYLTRFFLTQLHKLKSIFFTDVAVSNSRRQSAVSLVADQVTNETNNSEVNVEVHNPNVS